MSENKSKAFCGKRAVFLGDSITEGFATDKTYCSFLCEELGMTEINMGISSTVMCMGGHRSSRLPDIAKMPADVDYAVVFLGVNDWDQAVKNGMWGGTQTYPETCTYYTMGEKGTSDLTTLYGAFGEACRQLKEKYASGNTKVIFLSPLQTSWNNSVDQTVHDYAADKRNIHGFTQADMSAMIEDMCRDYGFYFFDLFRRSGIYYNSETDQNTDRYYVDGIHPNHDGHALIASNLADFFRAQFA